METVAQRLASFTCKFHIEVAPAQVIEKAKTCLINALGIGISGYEIPSARIARDIIKVEEGVDRERGATIFYDGTKVSAMGAAFANSVLLHSRTQEDTLGTTHIGTMVIPATFAIGEIEGSSGKDILEAIIVGYEIAGTFDRNVASFTTPRGLRASPIFGIIGTAASVSKLLRLSEEETINALGFAASLAGGTLEGFAAGTTEWRFQVGVASKEAILSALIAQRGAKAAPKAFEGDMGYLNVLAGSRQQAQSIGRDLGKTWEILNVRYKPYPVCAANQKPALIILELVKSLDTEYQRIEKINICLNPYAANYPGMAYKGPFGSVEATSMSAPFVVALACVDGKITLAGLHRFSDPKILGLVEKTDVTADQSLPFSSSRVEVLLDSGIKRSKEITVTPEYDMEGVKNLIKEAALGAGVSQDKIDRIVTLAQDIDRAPNIAEMVRALVTTACSSDV